MKTHKTKLQFKVNGIRKQLRAFTNAQASRCLAVKIQDIIDLKATKKPFSKELQEFIETMPHSIRHKLIEWGLLDAKVELGPEPLLTEYIEQLKDYMTKKERGQRHIREIIGTLKRVFKDCGFVTWTDILQDRLVAYLDEKRDGGRGISKRRYNGMLGMVKFFCGRMVFFGNEKFSPIRYTEKLENPQTDKRHERRILEDDELWLFLDAALTGLDYKGVSGPYRNFIYRFVLETALRSIDLRRLRVKDCNFKNHKILIRAGRVKNKKDTPVYLKPETSIELAQYCTSKLPDAVVFHLPNKLAAMVRFDLEAAGIPYKVDCRPFDFHSLKHQAASIYAENPETPETVRQALTHHSTPEMARRYSHAKETAQRKAVNATPDLRRPSESQQATGTDDKTLSKSCRNYAQPRTHTDTSGQKTDVGTPKTPVGANNKGTERFQ